MGNFAQTSLQASDAFVITPSNTLDIEFDPNNKKGYKFCYVHVEGASGLVQVTPVDGQGGPYSIVTTLIATLPGSGYNPGTHLGVTLNYLGGKVGTNVVANIVVNAAGQVTTVTYVSGGVGADTTTSYFFSGGQSGKLGGGTGFAATVSAITAAASDIALIYGVQGQILGGDMPIMVRRVWVTGTAATPLTAFVTKGGGSV